MIIASSAKKQPSAPVLSAQERMRMLGRPGRVAASNPVEPVDPPTSKLEETPVGKADGAAAHDDKSSAEVRLRAMSQAEDRERQLQKAAGHDGKLLASMRTLSALLCAVYARPGSSAEESSRMQALVELSERSQELGAVLARAVGADPDRSSYVQAVAMESAVALVTQQWTQGKDVRWAELIEFSAQQPQIMQAAAAMARSTVYHPVKTEADAQDRVHLSLHHAFWQLYELGREIDGMTPALAAGVITDVADYLREYEKPVTHPDLQTAWVQGSVRRMTDLICAELRARFVGQAAPTQEEIAEVLATARAGFEGVESYAQHILAPRTTHASEPVDRT